jgi:hypothetical protein
VIEPSNAPGAILDCRTATGRQLQAARGYASIMPTPVVVPGIGLIPAAASAVIRVPLPPGTWELSAQYTSNLNFTLSAGGKTWRMPAYEGRQGPFFRVGQVMGQGTGSPLMLVVKVDRPSRLTGPDPGLLNTYVPFVAATRLPDSRRIVPLHAACDQYVDWYRLR